MKIERQMPAKGEEYWIVTAIGHVAPLKWDRDRVDLLYWNFHNVWHSELDAIEASQILKNAYANVEKTLY